MKDPHINKAKLHLQKDPVLKPLIEKHQLKDYWGGNPNLFLDLVDIVTGQQLSLKAAATIYDRLINLYQTKTPTPDDILNTKHETLRSVGLSNSKAQYLKNLSQAVKEGTLNLETISDLPDLEVRDTITAIKGFGPWSAEMFLMFTLRRPDIFSVGDLGLRSAISDLYGLDRNDLKAIEDLSQNWKPYRTYASRYLWASLDNA